MGFLELLSPSGWVTVGVVVALFVALLKNAAPPDLLFLSATAFLSLLGIITPEQAFAGFSNAGMLTVAMLFVVAAGLRDTGVLDYLGHRVLGSAKSERSVLFRLAAVVTPMSAFLNNTPIAAMFVPVVIDWCRRHDVAPSKLLIPLSYLTILGGTCTLIGTSTNLVVNGLMVASGMPGMGLFEMGAVGLPYALIGIAYIAIAGRLLPERKELMEQLGESRREYMLEMQVQSDCRLAGATVEKGGLRQLPGLFLVEIDRDGSVIAPVNPDDVIEAGDRLVFAGIVSSIVELKKIGGLVPIADPHYEVTPKQQTQRQLCEAVISQTSPLIGKTIRDADFRATYGAAVVAVHRGEQRLVGKLGDVTLEPGDTLLMQVGSHFVRAHRNNPAFYLVSNVEEWRPLRRDRAGLALVAFAVLLVLMTTGIVPTLVASTLAASAMVAMGCVSSGDARRSIEWQVLITIAAAFGVGTALQESGAATAIATGFVESTHAWGPVAALAVIYALGSILTELVTNNAVAVLMFPVCIETARIYDIEPRPFLMALALAASASFMTPIGYQTNMMVYGPGGYRFGDFFKFGAPLNLILGVVAVILVPRIWGF